MSVLTEIAILQKPAVLIPMPASHQEDNATEFSKYNAVIYLDQRNLTPKSFSKFISDLVNDKSRLQNLSRNIGKVVLKDGTAKVVEEVNQIIRKSRWK